jgi:5-methylcytosine-specific restriction endonuclease McrA
MPYVDPVVRREYSRNYKRANRARFSGRQKIYDAAKHANERAALHGRPGTITTEDVERVFAVGECFWCGVKTAALTIDHVIGLHDPRSTNRPDNLVAACGTCNKKKSQKTTPEAWSKHGERCVSCNRADMPHAAKGLCRVCDRAARRLDLTEAEFQRQVVELAQLTGWWVYHTHDSRQSNAGFPDLVLIRHGRVVFAELKSRRGKVRPEQQHVLDLLGTVAAVETFLWRPADWDQVEAVLRSKATEAAA